MIRLTLMVAFSVICLAACNGRHHPGDTGTGEEALVDAVDGGADPGADQSQADGSDLEDAGADSGADAEGDAGTDAGGGDAGEDAGLDASGDPGVDAGADQGDDPGGDAGGDPGGDGPADAGDSGPGEGFFLAFEPGAQACGRFADGRSWLQEFNLTSRVEFSPQTVFLPTDQPSFAAEFIQRVQVGPDRVEPLPLGPGQITHEFLHSGDPLFGCHYYRFIQPYDLAGQPFSLQCEFEFCLQDGVPTRTEIRFGDDFADAPYLNLRGVIADGQDYYTQLQYYDRCIYRQLSLWVITALDSGGGRVVLHKRFDLPMVGSGPARLVWAEATVDGQLCRAQDCFGLVYAAEHHNWNENYFMRLEPPVGSVHGLLLQESKYIEPPTQLIYLDASWQELYRRPLTYYNEQMQ